MSNMHLTRSWQQFQDDFEESLPGAAYRMTGQWTQNPHTIEVYVPAGVSTAHLPETYGGYPVVVKPIAEYPGSPVDGAAYIPPRKPKM